MHGQGEKHKITNQQLIRVQNKLIKVQNLQKAMKMMKFLYIQYALTKHFNDSTVIYVDYTVKWLIGSSYRSKYLRIMHVRP